jgi:hypothetical protein
LGSNNLVEQHGYLKLAADGLSSPHLRGDFLGLLDQKLALGRLPAPATAGRDYFPRLRDILVEANALVAEVEEKIAQKPENEQIRGVASALLRAGQVLNQSVPKSKEYLNFSSLPFKPDELDKAFDHAWTAIKGINSISIKRPHYVPRVIRRALGSTTESRLRTDLHGLIADCLLGDLSAVVRDVNTEDKKRWNRQKNYEFSKLLLVLDDFEVIGPTLSDFIFGALVPRLEVARFPTVILVIGRDNLQASNPDWFMRYRQYVRNQIRLLPFSKEQALEFLTSVGIVGEEAERVYSYSEGFPFLLSLIAEGKAVGDRDGSEGDDSFGADLPRQFYDRTTRWMTGQQKEWLDVVVYLVV